MKKMNNIYVFSRQKFKEEFSSLTVEQFMAGAFISIHSPKIGMSFNDTDQILESGPNVLNLWFHDADPEDEKLLIGTHREPVVYFNEDMASKIKNFVEENKDAKFWFIHCTAGICRSGAIGEVLADFFQIPYHQFKRDNPQIKPNIHVKNILKRIMLQDSNITNT